jgi:hypothetical protein
VSFSARFEHDLSNQPDFVMGAVHDSFAGIPEAWGFFVAWMIGEVTQAGQAIISCIVKFSSGGTYGSPLGKVGIG